LKDGNNTKRVVITGIGAVTPVGTGKNVFWENIKNGVCGIDGITLFDATGYKASLAAEVKNFTPEDFIEKKEAKRQDRFTQFAVASSVLAKEDANIDFSAHYDPYRVGIIFGSGIGGMNTFETEHTKLMEKGAGRISPFFIPMIISNMAAGMISMRFGLKGVSYSTVTACASSAHAVGEAYRAIKHGYLDCAVAGGSEATVTPISIAGFINMQALSLSNDKNRASIPFDKERDGFVMGEGACCLILEEYESAVKRGACIYAEIKGYGATSDAYHMTSPDPEGKGAAKAMELAVSESGLGIESVNYINAHGTGTLLNDKFETLAIKSAFGEHAKKLAVSSTKSMTGHMLGAAGAVEAAVCALSLKNGVVPPTVNYKVPDPELDLDYVPNKSREVKITGAVSNSLGFGGHNASLYFAAIGE
jgi:3-oxoacyl-[acyl-carrier-protein] synthase II